MLNNIFRLSLLSILCCQGLFADNMEPDKRPGNQPPQPQFQVQTQPPPSFQQSNVKLNAWGCTPDCKCGCNEGKPCTCNNRRPEAYSDYSYDGYSNSYDAYDNNDDGYGDYSENVWHSPEGGYRGCRYVVPDSYYSEHLHCNCAPPPYFHVPPFDRIVAEECGLCGLWLPEEAVIFRPLIADPRQITYSVGWRFDDQVLVRNVIDVSFGDYLPIYRWFKVWPWCGDLQIDLEGALWATFDPLHNSSPLINADYYGGLSVSYGFDLWEFRFRAYHISCHIGDEFLLNHPGFDRRNASSEFVDFYISWDWTPEIRLYSGIGYTVREDEEFHTGRLFGAIGTEVRMNCLGFTDWCNQLYGEPFLGMHFRYNKNFKHHIDATYVLGYEWGKLCGLCRKLRIFLEYHDGYSLEGQFQKLATNYFSIRASYGF